MTTAQRLETAGIAARNISDERVRAIAISAVRRKSLAKLYALRNGLPTYVLDKLDIVIRCLEFLTQKPAAKMLAA